MRTVLIALFLSCLSGCNFDSTLIIETPDDPLVKAKMCRNGIVYTIDKDFNAKAKLTDNRVVKCHTNPSSIDELDEKIQWHNEGVRINLTQYNDLLIW